MPNLFLHVGFPKTGSTAIQNFLFLNRNELIKYNIYYPTPLLGKNLIKEKHLGHISMSQADSNVRFDVLPFNSYRERYLADIVSSGCESAILSAEGFIYDNPVIFSSFQDKFKISVICFIRNFFDYILAGIKQLIKEGLRPDLFDYLSCRNFHVLAMVEEYLLTFGRENCFFFNYDFLRTSHSILDSFLEVVGCGSGDFHQNSASDAPFANVTPSDALTMFMYQLSFFPFSYSEWTTLKEEFLQIEDKKWESYQASFIPRKFFNLDDECKRRIRRQGELLQDPEWYDYTLSRCDQLLGIENHDLPPEIQHGIWEKLSDEARSIILRYWPNASKAKLSDPLLPSMEKIAPEVFDQMKVLRHGYTVSLGNTLQLQEQLLESETSYELLGDVVRKEKQRLASRCSIAARHCLAASFFHFLCDCLAPLFSSSARQSYEIRRSGLFDIGWYLEKYQDVAEAGIDPILHYVRYGAKEGRDPAPWFSTAAYLQAYSDVATSELNPFYHYIFHGIIEGRRVSDSFNKV